MSTPTDTDPRNGSDVRLVGSYCDRTDRTACAVQSELTPIGVMFCFGADR